MELFAFPEMALHCCVPAPAFVVEIKDCHCCSSSGAYMLRIHPKTWEDAIFLRGMVVSWQGGCFRLGIRLWCVGGSLPQTDGSLFRFVGRAVPHHEPALLAQGQVSFGTTVGFCWLKVYEITCIPQANSCCRESLLVMGTSILAVPCHMWFPCWHWRLCLVFSKAF